MSRNVYRVFLDLLPATPLQIATVTAIDGDIARLSCRAAVCLRREV